MPSSLTHVSASSPGRARDTALEATVGRSTSAIRTGTPSSSGVTERRPERANVTLRAIPPRRSLPVPSTTHMNLASLPPFLRDETALTNALGTPNTVIAVPEAARPISIAALQHLSARRPLVVACPTGTAAGEVFQDLSEFMPDGEVVLFPAWQPLPFERVTPNVETMGRRLDVLW